MEFLPLSKAHFFYRIIIACKGKKSKNNEHNTPNPARTGREAL
jgi:hypothetical protein